MKKYLILLGIAVLSSVFAGAGCAETVGNAIDVNFPPGQGVYSAELGEYVSLRAGFDAEFVTKKEFNAAGQSSDVELEGAWYMVKLSCTLFDRVEPYISLGWSDLDMSWYNGGEHVTAEADHDAGAWGFGLKVNVLEFEESGFRVFAAGSYRSTKPDIRSVGNKGGITSEKFNIFERQLAGGVSKEIILPGYKEYVLMPYIGALYSETTARVSFTSGSEVFNGGADGQKNNLGLFFGADFLFVDNFSFNAEVRLLDQTAFSGGFTALF